jgi:hypothetical protein
MTSELDSRQIPESAALRGSHLRQLEVLGFCVFVTPRLLQTKILEIRMFANLKLRKFLIPENREFPVPEKTYLKNFVKLNVSRVTGFPEFPNRVLFGTNTKLRHMLGSLVLV